MEEVDLSIRSNMPFTSFSREFPELRIFRWCSSAVDYLEIYGPNEMLRRALLRMRQIAEQMDSVISGHSLHGERLTVMLGCRCSVDNSSIRMAESRNLMWEAPASYYDGVERIKLISFGEGDLLSLYERLDGVAEIRVERKSRMLPESLRDIYAISLSELTGKLTSKQLRYLRDAIKLGFYASPRRVMIEEIAKLHGIGKSAMQEHLNKARNKLLQALEPYLNLL